MKTRNLVLIQDVQLPWSNRLSAKMWQVEGSDLSRGKVVVGVPELGLHCYGNSQQEAAFRLFTSLLKYYRQLKEYPDRLTEKGLSHLDLLTSWVASMEKRLTERSEQDKVVSLDSRR